jgi:hypothetical protein
MHMSRMVVVVAVWSALTACGVAEGRYRVQGKVTAESGGIQVSLPITTVLVRARTGRADQSPAMVGHDGAYDESYGFGGMLPFAWFSGDGDPLIEFSALGFRKVIVPLKSTGNPSPGVSRHTCDAKSFGACFGIDVALQSEAAGP